MTFFSPYETVLGTGGVEATESGISKVLLPGDQLLRTKVLKPSRLTDTAAQLLRNYFEGGEQPFEQLPLDLSRLTHFRQRVLTMVRSIEYGNVMTYGEVAKIAGMSKGARAVGGALASNPIPIIIPCHRVVASNGALTGFTAPGGIGMKKVLLEKEGLVLIGNQIVMKSGSFAQAFLLEKK